MNLLGLWQEVMSRGFCSFGMPSVPSFPLKPGPISGASSPVVLSGLKREAASEIFRGASALHAGVFFNSFMKGEVLGCLRPFSVAITKYLNLGKV
jgi:hypothetical protein